MKKVKISAVISAFNEENKIEDCLKSLKGFVDEIIFIDNSSSDKTVQIAKKYTNNIFVVPNDPVMLNRNKNFGFTKASGQWIMSIDADERVTAELAREMKKSIANTTYKAFEFPRKNIIFGKWIQNSIWWPDYNTRLFRKNFGQFPLKHVHEKLYVNGETGRLANPLTHYNYETISQFVKKLDNTYTESEAENFIKSGKNINWYDAIRWPVGDFVKTFFLQKGYKDGFHGLILSQLQAFYAFIFFAKVWEKKEKFKDLTPQGFLRETEKELVRAAKEIMYWIYTAKIESGSLRSFYFKIKRRLM